MGVLHYAPRMRRLITLLLLFVCVPASAVICKTVDDQGRVTYSDVPASECQNPVRLPESSTYQPRQLPAALPRRGDAADAAQDKPFTGYTLVRIEQPANDGTVRNNEGQVPTTVAVQPALQPGHKLRLSLDGVPIQPDFAATSVILNGVERGTHLLSAYLVDEGGKVLQSAVPVRFTLRKASVLLRPGSSAEPNEDDGNADGASDETDDSDDGATGEDDDSANGGLSKTDDRPDVKPPGPYSPQQADDPYAPQGSADYSPGSPPASTTPGRINPAFTPNYTPR